MRIFNSVYRQELDDMGQQELIDNLDVITRCLYRC